MRKRKGKKLRNRGKVTNTQRVKGKDEGVKEAVERYREEQGRSWEVQPSVWEEGTHKSREGTVGESGYQVGRGWEGANEGASKGGGGDRT